MSIEYDIVAGVYGQFATPKAHKPTKEQLLIVPEYNIKNSKLQNLNYTGYNKGSYLHRKIFVSYVVGCPRVNCVSLDSLILLAAFSDFDVNPHIVHQTAKIIQGRTYV